MSRKFYSRVVVKPRLNEIMEIKGITQEQLAEKAGVSQPTISRFDVAKMHQSRVLFAISNALECSIEDLFILTEERVRSKYPVEH